MSRPHEVPTLAALLLVACLAAGGEPGKAAGPTRQDGMERFRKLTAEERLQRVEKLAGARALVSVARADLDVTVVERGVVEPAEASDVVCRVKALAAGSTIAGTIKWVIDDGTIVKKGQRLVELDDTALRDRLTAARIALDRATADKVAAGEALQIIEKQNELDVRTAEIKLKRARLALKKYTGKDPDEKEILEASIEQAKLGLETARLLGKSRETRDRADLKAKAAIEEQQGKQKEALDAQLAACIMRAPQAGVVLFHVPETTRFGGGGERIVAQGEKVHEGQKLLRVCGLDRFTFTTRVHEALVARVQVGRSARVRIDAFPLRELRGGVASIAAIPSQKDWLSSDVKVYPVQVALADKAPGLKPGMSGEVRIEVERRAKVLQVPLGAILRSGRDTFCFVKVGKGLHERRVTIGTRNDLSVEIREGLKEGEQVLRSPRAVAGKAAPAARSDVGRRESASVLVRSVRPAVAPGRRTFSASYGLTYRDLEQIRALPDVARAVPVRSFPIQAGRLQHLANAVVAGTTPEYADLTGLPLAEGRFLDEEDERWTRNVAVLGADVAERLFPEEEPQGAVVRLGTSAYRVVGVLQGHERDEVNRSVYIPLRTCRARFGESVVVRRAGAITRETVPLSEVLVDLRPAARAGHVAGCIETLLEEAHPRKDWAVTRAAAPR